jgi:aminoglycoside phosphotransferase (APT) family kinase protein
MHLAWAFEDYARGEYESLREHAYQGILLQPASLLKRGVLSMLLKSFLNNSGTESRPPEHVCATDSDDEALVAERQALQQRVATLLEEPVIDMKLLSGRNRNDHVYSVQLASRRCILRYASNERELSENVALLARLAGTRLPVPAIIAWEPHASTGNALLLETFLPGAPIPLFEWQTGKRSSRAMKHLAGLLRELHALPAGCFGREGTLPASETPPAGQSFLDWAEVLAQRVEGAFLLNRMSSELIDVIASSMEHVLAEPAAPVLCHGDLSKNNILVEGNQVAGLIDWEFACGGDPAYDLAQFFVLNALFWHKPQAGDCFVKQFVAGYAQGYDPALLRRVTAYMMLYSVICIAGNYTEPEKKRVAVLHELLRMPLFQAN